MICCEKVVDVTLLFMLWLQVECGLATWLWQKWQAFTLFYLILFLLLLNKKKKAKLFVVEVKNISLCENLVLVATKII